MPYSNLTNLKGSKLWLVTNGWFAPDYSLTDGQNQYGKIYNEGILSSATILQTEEGLITALSAGNGDITLKNFEGKIIGYAETKLFNKKLQLTLHTGFNAILIQPNLLRMIYVWLDADGKKLMEIEGNIHSSLCITIDDSFTATSAFLIVLFTSIKYLIYLNINQAI